MPETNSSTHEQLVLAFKAVREALAQHAASEDGGTCNLDSAVFFPDRTKNATIEAAAREAGLHIFISKWLGRRCVFVGSYAGQGNCRTRQAEAARKALEAHGLNAHVYYQMD